MHKRACASYVNLMMAEYIYTSLASLPSFSPSLLFRDDWKQMTQGSSFSPFTACQSLHTCPDPSVRLLLQSGISAVSMLLQPPPSRGLCSHITNQISMVAAWSVRLISDRTDRLRKGQVNNFWLEQLLKQN